MIITKWRSCCFSFVLKWWTDHFISETSDDALAIESKLPESDLSILPVPEVLPDLPPWCRVMSQTQVLCEEMVIIVWVLNFAWIAWADFACQMKISCVIDRDLFVTSFLGVENCSPANVVIALVDFTQGVSFTLKHLRWFLKQKCVIPSLRHVLKHASDVWYKNAFLHGWKPVSYA